MLDLLRATAAQMVCIGHAWNLTYEDGNAFHATINERATYIPYIGVMLFFILSGFVIAHTLVEKTRNKSHSLLHYGIDRFSRIYSAYLPALLLIAALDLLAFHLGAPIQLDTIGNFLRNLAMLQGYPANWAAGTFGTAGQLSSLAAEFHIYFFVGGVFFFCIGRNRVAAIILAALMLSMPLAYLSEVQMSDRNLFALWLLGFGGYFICRSTKIEDMTDSICFVAVAVAATWYWLRHRVPNGDEYRLTAYLPMAIAFTCVTVATQRSRILAPVAGLISGAAGYSFSLFLTHFTLIKIVIYFWPGPKWIGFLGAVVFANIIAYFFARLTESRHKQLAAILKHYLTPSVPAMVVAERAGVTVRIRDTDHIS